MYKFCFGWLDRRAAKQNKQRFAEEVRTELSFLFSEHGARIIPNQGMPFPPGFDGAYITVALGVVRLLFVRGRGEFGVSVASQYAPSHWEDFDLVADAIGQWDTPRTRARSDSFETFAKILRLRLDRLQEALSEDRFEVTLSEVVKHHNANVDNYADRLSERGVAAKFY